MATAAVAQTASDAADLRRMLDEFLAGASRNDAAAHERFWAEDLIYTGSSGRRVGKADILRDVRAAPPPKPTDPATTYSAEDVRIQLYGDTAVVAFRLVGATTAGARTSTGQYLNSGTFLRRQGRWQVVSWQATRLPRPQEAAKAEAGAAQGALRDALRAGDARAVAALTAEGFVWTRDGQPVARQRLLDTIGAFKDALPEVTDAAVSVLGETAIVRWPASTLTLALVGGEWKAVALHTSRIP
jgi:ketosteroid isomerase-like protein